MSSSGWVTTAVDKGCCWAGTRTALLQILAMQGWAIRQLDQTFAASIRDGQSAGGSFVQHTRRAEGMLTCFGNNPVVAARLLFELHPDVS